MQVKDIKMSLMLDIYKSLLTDKQFSIMDMYFNLDYSLTEIAENEGVSRQGVLDIIKRSEAKLIEYEEKLGLMKKFEITEASLKVLEKENLSKEALGAIAALRSAWEE